MKKKKEINNSLIKAPEKENSSEWLKDFLKLPTIWYNLSSCVITTEAINPDKSLAIFNHRIKGFYKKYVESGELTEKELREAVAVMVKEYLILSEQNLLETVKYISMGFYRDYLIDLEADFKYFEEEKRRNQEYENLKKDLENFDWEDI